MTIRNDIDPEAWLDTITLDSGGHSTADAGLCVMEAVAFLAGEPHSDHPDCVSPVLGAFLRSWNDSLPDDDRQVLKPYALRVIGTANDGLDEARAWIATDWLVRVHTPAWLRLAGLVDQAELLEQLAPLNADTTPTILPALKAIRTDAAAAGDAAGDAAWDAAGDAAWDAAWAAAWDAARAAAWDAARAAAWDAARAAAGDAAWDAAWDAARAAARDAAWDAARAAARAAARDAARAAARAAVEPTKKHLQLSALGLIEQLIEPAA